ncbi:hypothetical protein [Halocatena salina]|uniref:Uncharacterized protein n=1 Tax=Halocatena salina TaxID=2934340 RepID=A0A8U0A3Z9_9EURY|nr:hypothetical protein [Halocatena salina]UPM43178.1 hypothetical protein MW046_01720 [Halocatena salina]
MPGEIVDLDSEDLYEIKIAYKSFWNRFKGSQGIKAEGNSDNINVSKYEGKLQVEVPTYFKISGLQYRRDRPDDLFDICFRPELTIRGREHDDGIRYEIDKSTTRVSYLRRQSDREDDGRFPAEIKQGMHYDFESEPDARHPIFHVQYAPTAIGIGVLNQEYRITNEDELLEEYPDFPRIPSPPMDFVGILYLIIKDHEQAENATWPNKVLTSLENLPTFPKGCFDPNPQSGREMIPEWWYVHADGGPHIPDGIIDMRCVD